MRTPQTQKEVQKLTGRLAALKRFVSKLVERCLPLFEVLKEAKTSECLIRTSECQEAFKEIKHYLDSAPIITKTLPEESLYLYLYAGPLVVSATLVWEEDRLQKPVYYVSQKLKDAKRRYPNLEKFLFTIVMASRKIKHYFQGRVIKVITDQPLKKILQKPEISARVVNWAMYLSQSQIEYIPRTVIKAQAISEFIMECTFPNQVTPSKANPRTLTMRTM